MAKVVIKTENLRTLLAKNNFSQRDFASKIGISEQSLSDMLRGIFGASANTRQRICDLLQCDFEDVFKVI